MFLLNTTNYKYSNSHFQKALDESEQTFNNITNCTYDKKSVLESHSF